MPPQRLARVLETETPIDRMDDASRTDYLTLQKRTIADIFMNGKPQDAVFLSSLETNPDMHPAVRELIKRVQDSIRSGGMPIEAITRRSSSLDPSNMGDGCVWSSSRVPILDETS